MANIISPFLFRWEDVERSSDLRRLQMVLESLPDEPIVAALEGRRGRGRDTYPVRATWNAVVAGIVYQHPSVESLLRELRRNAELREICGFNPLRGAEAVPTTWAMSRFLDGVISHRELIEGMFDALVYELGELLPGFGTHLAFDGKAIPSFSTGRKARKTGQTSDPDADWGTKTYRGVDAAGKAWQKLNRWFGYQLHLIVDSTLEIPVAFEVMRASTSEVRRLVPMVEGLKARHPEIVERCQDLAADRGLDSGEVNRELWEEHGIKPVIDSRRMWKDEKREPGFDACREITRLLDPEAAGNVVYTERGEVRCVCPASGTERAMAFWGFEAERETLRYRCPGAAKGFRCAGRAACERGTMGRETTFGRVVRVPLETDRRIFTPIPRETPSWKRLYAARTSVERVNARIDQAFGFEEHTIRGLAKMETRVGLALAVMLAMAVAAIRDGRGEMVRSLVGSPRRRAA